jgi:hypothetical protein
MTAPEAPDQNWEDGPDDAYAREQERIRRLRQAADLPEDDAP